MASSKAIQGTLDVRSEIFCKPAALFTWLTIAKARGYTEARLVMHGGDSNTYNGLRNDPLGFDMQYANKNGQVYGNGIYFGLSDHVTVGYNKSSGFAPGTAIIALVLTKGCRRGRTVNGSYKPFSLSTPVHGVDNCLLVHDVQLVLPIGLAVATHSNGNWSL